MDYDAEELARYESGGREQQDALYDALPLVYRRRIDKFRQTREDFRWRYEGYELAACQVACSLVAAFDSEEAVQAWAALPFEERHAHMPDLDWPMLSSNQVDYAVRSARLWFRDPRLVVADHGAMTILVGCPDYGCPHPYTVAETAEATP